MINPEAVICPICNNENLCEINAVLSGGSCWCMVEPERIPKPLLDLVPPEQRGQACVCKACIDQFRQGKLQQPSPSPT